MHLRRKRKTRCARERGRSLWSWTRRKNCARETFLLREPYQPVVTAHSVTGIAQSGDCAARLNPARLSAIQSEWFPTRSARRYTSAGIPDGAKHGGTLLDARDYHVARQVPTGASPYGVAFDRDGKRMLVAAARSDTLQVFDTTSFENIASIPVGKRCWHFSFTPDDARLLVACGRSDAVYVFDARSYQPIRRVEGLTLNWGIVTNPRSIGSLDTP